VNLLLDTCTFLWLTLEPARLSAQAVQLISDPDNRRWLSAVSVWEVAVLFSRGRITLSSPPRQFVAAQCRHYQIRLLPFRARAAVLEPDLPRPHRDPADRQLVCQALAHGLTILTPDPQIQRYPVPTAW
jgi:PIN domain nuclease of toxin-antitoxin system